ncbi:acyltransferase [Pusillimonas sp. MFBS29]|uniref:acyltransferase family protein n=1 Tax=Pusillimonas sp. MFBS29 TaxID=2886690 RepID=UPI001D129349|nr:acyltransferase [Pusillimonas sp. MFBS29]MCC2596129.1 acyltransferase [Pusillimonas sp. MFBS29]
MRSPNTVYLSRLDHLRFYAAALVLVYHYFHRFVGNVAYNNPLASLINEGHVGIGLFMVLSGFIFSVIAQGKVIHYGWFIFNRFIRIYPLYVFAVFLAVSLMVYNQGQVHRGVFDILGWLLAFRPPTIVEVPYFPHLWTIPVEFSFYLLFPFLHRFFTERGVRYFLGLLALLLVLRIGVYLEYGTVRFLAYETVFGRLDQFLIGYLCGWLYAEGRWSKALGFPLALPIAFGVLLLTVQWLNQRGGSLNMDAWWWTIWPLVEGLAWAFLVLAYMHFRIPIPKRVDRVLSRLGEYSFSIYIVHMFVVIVASKHIGLLGLSSNIAVDATLSALLTALPLTLLISALTYAVIEKPFLAYRRVYAAKQG